MTIPSALLANAPLNARRRMSANIVISILNDGVIEEDEYFTVTLSNPQGCTLAGTNMVKDIEVTCRFYARVMGLRRESFGEGRVALHFGRQKINLHPYPSPIEPKTITLSLSEVPRHLGIELSSSEVTLRRASPAA